VTITGSSQVPAKIVAMPKPRKRVAVLTVSTLVVIAVTGAVVLVLLNRPEPPAPAARPRVETTTVREADLANTRSEPGTLGFGAQRVIKGTGTGVVTGLPAVGDVARRGKPLFRVNDLPVPVFFGATPMFRPLGTLGMKGSDVAVVMDNLAELGYRPGRRPNDDAKAEFTPTVARALKEWQADVGLEETGTLDVGQVLVLDGPVRTSAVLAQPGDPVAGELFAVTANTRVITLSMAIAEAGALPVGTAVTVVRPDGREIPAKVASVATATPEADPDGGTGQGGAPDQRMEVVVTPDDPAAVADLDAARVEVKITTETRTAVLVVPVEALVALREGGYAVQLPGGELRAVETGMYSRALVEISGTGITEGLTVVTAS
jgi:hypothetical protein